MGGTKLSEVREPGEVKGYKESCGHYGSGPKPIGRQAAAVKFDYKLSWMERP